MRKYAFIGVTILIIVATLVVVRKSGGWGKNAPAGKHYFIPYTVVLKETNMHVDRGPRDVTELTYARRSDGSHLRRAIDLQPTVDKISERVIQLASGEEITVNDLTNLKSTIIRRPNFTGNFVLRHRNPQEKCLTTLNGQPFSTENKFVGEETYRGYRVVRIKNSGAEFLYALDVGCAHIYDRIVFDEKQSSEHNLVSLTQGEPDASLFTVAANAREVMPSERFLSSRKDRSSCVPESSCGRQMLEMDRYYLKHRVAAR